MESEHRLYDGPMPYTAFNPAPATVGTTGDTSPVHHHHGFGSHADVATVIAWLLIGGMFLLLAVPLLRSSINDSNETVDDAESGSIDHLSERRAAIDQIADNAKESIEAIADGENDPAEVVVDNALDSVNVISNESITDTQNVAEQAKADLQ